MKTRFLLTTVSFIALALAVLVSPTPVDAAGCGGYVNLMQWGCAPWDNNPPKAGVTPNYPAPPVAKPAPIAAAPPAAPVISNDGGSLISHDGGSLISHDGGSLISNDGSTKPVNKLLGQDGSSLIGNDGSSKPVNKLLGQDGSSLIGNDGSSKPVNKLLGQDGSSLIGNDGSSKPVNKLVGNDGSSIISEHGGGVISNDGGSFVPKGTGVSAFRDTGPTPEQIAMTAAQDASTALTKASAQVKSDAQGLSDALKKYGENDQTGTVKQFQDNLDKHEAALKPLAIDLAIKVTLVPVPADQAAANATTQTLQSLANNAGVIVKQNVDAANTIHDVAVRDAAAAATGPTAQDRAAAAAATAAATAAFNKAQTAAANAQTVASAADAAYKTVSQGVIRPADPVARVGVDLVGENNLTGTLKAKSDATQALLAAANKGNPPMSTNDLNNLRTQAVSDSKAYFYQQDMQQGGYAEKYARADSANADLTSAKAAVATLTAVAKPTDPAALAALNTAIATANTVQQASQAKFDQLSSDARIVQLQASVRDGANQTDAQKDQSRAEITRLQGVSAASTATLATIVKSNPVNASIAAVVANNFGGLKTTDFDYTATKTGGAIKQISGAPVPVPVGAALASAVVIPALAQLSQSAAAAVQTANAAVQQANTAVQAANTANQGGQLKQTSTITSNSNFDVTQTLAVLTKAGETLKVPRVTSLAPAAGGSPTATTPTATPVAVATAPAAPQPDPEKVKEYNAQKVWLDKAGASVALADKGKAAFDLAVKNKDPAAAGYTDFAKFKTDAVAGYANAQKLTDAAQAAIAADLKTKAPASPAPVVVANVGPTTAGLARPAALPAGATAVTTTPSTSGTKTDEVFVPAKLTPDQSKAVHQALRTIPGNLTKGEEKSFAVLSTMVDRATTKGLTAEEAVYLKEGLAALAEKHPKAEKQSGLTTIGNGIAPAHRTAVVTPAAVAPALASTTPAAVVAPKGASKEVMHTDVKPAIAVTAPSAKLEPPKATPSATPVMHTDVKPTVAATTPSAAVQPTAAKPSHVTASPSVAPKAPALQATAPRALPPALAAAKPPAAPSAKPQTCTPNMQNGKQVGMICH